MSAPETMPGKDAPDNQSGLLPDPLLADLERRVQHALRARELGDLEVIAYGDSSVVLACQTPSGKLACKRLPPFSCGDDLSSYRHLLGRYAAELNARGVAVLRTDLQAINTGGDNWIAYCVQPAVARASLLAQFLSVCHETEAQKKLDRLLEIVLTAVDARLGLDADVTNWCLLDDDLALIDITTPMLRDEQLNELLKVELFLASFPKLVQRVVRKDRVKPLIDKFYRPRGVLLDVLCGLYRERLGRYAPYLMRRVNKAVTQAITPGELRRYYVVNETLWSGIRKLQFAERLWRTRAAGAAYPFLLPPKNAFAGRLAARPPRDANRHAPESEKVKPRTDETDGRWTR